MKTIATIFAMIVTMTFVGCGSTQKEENAENVDSTKAVAIDTTVIPTGTAVTVPADTAK